jgi:hypothetical protein
MSSSVPSTVTAHMLRRSMQVLKQADDGQGLNDNGKQIRYRPGPARS